MNTYAKIAVVVALVCAVAVALALKSSRKPSDATQAVPHAPAVSQAPAGAQLPRLVELGSTTCVPCKMMAPVLDDLRKEYPASLQVEFIDVTENRAAAEEFAIRVIPTQVFLGKDGKELFRHEGFFAKADIVAKWKELGVNLGDSAPR